MFATHAPNRVPPALAVRLVISGVNVDDHTLGGYLATTNGGICICRIVGSLPKRRIHMLHCAAAASVDFSFAVDQSSSLHGALPPEPDTSITPSKLARPTPSNTA